MKRRRNTRNGKMPSPTFARAFNSAVSAYGRGDLAEARDQFQEALKKAPRHAATLHHLGLICQQLGNIDESVAYLERAVAADPKDPVAFNNLGNVLVARGELDGAVDAYKKSVALSPDYVNALYNLAKALAGMRRSEEAIDTWRRLLELAPDDVAARNEFGIFLMREGRHEESEAVFRSALGINPDDVESHNNLGVCLMYSGDLRSARECFENALERDPKHARAIENIVRSRRFGAEDGPLIARLEKLTESVNASPEERMLYHFSLGKIYDDCGDAGRAFRHYEKGNALRRKSARFDDQEHARWVDRVIATFSKEYFSARQDFGDDSELPVFIIGMIRSGTTLVEQIVASHPAVSGGGELLHVPDLVRSLPARTGGGKPFPECALDMSADQARELGAQYVELLRRGKREALRITDKLPTNFLFLGLISAILPRARVIHCTRDPMDVAVSIYFQRFAEGHDYAYSLEDISAYYREYLRLMNHWRQVIRNPVHQVSYESLVENQEAESRALIAFLDLDWDPACLDFDKADRVVSTASHWQVRQPVYRGSIARWRRFEPYLGPLKSSLDAATETAVQGRAP